MVENNRAESWNVTLRVHILTKLFKTCHCSQNTCFSKGGSTDLPGTLLFNYSKFVLPSWQVLGLWSHKRVLLSWQFQGGLHLTKEMSFVCFFLWTNKNVITSWNLNFQFPGYKKVRSFVKFSHIQLPSVWWELLEIWKRQEKNMFMEGFLKWAAKERNVNWSKMNSKGAT